MASEHSLDLEEASRGADPQKSRLRLFARRGRGRDLWLALAQLSVLGILLAAASKWTSSAGPGQGGAAQHVAMPRINPSGAGAPGDESLEGGAFRTLGVVEREVDFSSDLSAETSDRSEASRQRSQDARDPSVKDFKANLARFGLPVIKGAEVKRAIERQEGPYVVRELHFDASKGVGSVTRHYRNLFRNQGYRMQETHLGGLDGVGRELVGTRGKNRLVAKVRVDDTGRAVQVSIRQRIEPL